MSYLRGLYLDSFQTTKRHSYDGYSNYIAIFNSFHEAVYPVGVTTNRSCFTRIIVITPEPFIGFVPNLMLEFAFGLPFCVPNFKAIGVRVCLLQQFLQVCEKTKKKKKKTKKKKRNFSSSYLGNGWSDFLQIWNVDSLGWRATV